MIEEAVLNLYADDDAEKEYISKTVAASPAGVNCRPQTRLRARMGALHRHPVRDGGDVGATTVSTFRRKQVDCAHLDRPMGAGGDERQIGIKRPMTQPIATLLLSR